MKVIRVLSCTAFVVVQLLQEKTYAYTDPFPVPAHPGLSVVTPVFEESFESGSGGPGVIGKAAQPNSEMVQQTPTALQGAKSEMTVEFWAKGGALSGFVKGPGFSIDGQINMGPYGSHRVVMTLAQDGVFVGTALSVIGLKESDSAWHHYVVSCDRKYISTYVDGELRTRQWVTNSANQIGPMTNGTNVVEYPDITLKPNSPVDELKIYDKALTPQDVKRNFENSRRNTHVIYVAPTGAGDGSSVSTPKSLASALGALQPETRLVLTPGTYNGADFQVNGIAVASPESRVLIMGQPEAGPVIVQTSSGSTGPAVSSSGWLTLRNIRFVNESSSASAALSLGQGTGPVEVDACVFVSVTAGLKVDGSNEVTAQNNVVRAAGEGIWFAQSRRALVRNNTIYQGQTGISFLDNSKFPRFLQNLVVGQTVKSLALDTSSSSDKMLADNNVYSPGAGGLLATVDGTDFSSSQFVAYQEKFFSLIGGWGGNEGRVSRYPELNSFVGNVIFEDASVGDFRLKAVSGNVTDAGTASSLTDFLEDGVEAALWDAMGIARPLPNPLDRANTSGGNAPDVGAYETAAPLTFSFNLPVDRQASAGVYNESGQLVATLFNGRPLKAGPQTIYWNGLNDQHEATPNGNYSIRVLCNDVKYVWEGAVGNNADPQNGRSAARLFFSRPSSMAVDHQGSSIYLSLGYQEAFLPIWKMKTSNPTQIEHRMGFHAGVYSKVISDVATDGQRAYFVSPMGASGSQPCAGFIAAYGVSDNVQVTGGNWIQIQGSEFHGILVGNPAAVQEVAVRGVAVQNQGDLLFASVRGDNRVYVYHKTTGAKQSFEIVVTAPDDITVDGRGDLWVVSGTNLLCYSTSNSWASPVRTISNLVAPVALTWTAHTYGSGGFGGAILVADGGGSQQVKAFNGDSGLPLWTLGQAGGYANGINVAIDKFEFNLHRIDTDGETTLIAAMPDGSFWVQDHATDRVMKFDAGRNFQENETLAAKASFYAAAVDVNNPTRAFADDLEYEIDYSKNFGPSNGFWKPVKYYGPEGADLVNVATLSNGRTYAVKASIGEFAEITADGIRRTGIKTGYREAGVPWRMQADGSLTTTNPVSPLGSLYKRDLTGFDVDGNPEWAPAVKISDVNYSSTTLAQDPLYIESWEDATTGLNITYNGSANGGYHIGAVAAGSTEWQWRAARSTRLDGRGSWDSSGQYPGANGLAGVLDGSIFVVYRGEFWQNVQANQLMQYSTEGLFVGQFGVSSLFATDEASVPGMSSNMLSVVAVKVGQKIYLFANDESSNSGLGCYRVDGLDTLHKYSGTVTVGGTTTPPPTSGGPEGYWFIANENESYTFSQTVDVAYGANGIFSYEYGVTGAVAFNNVRFGDPIAGVFKKGYYRLSDGETPPSPTPDLPSGWVSADIGGPGVVGSTIYDANQGKWTVAGSGADIWNNSDQFQYSSRTVSGDAEIIAKVSSMTATDAWAKTGLMFRNDQSAGSAYVIVVVSAQNGVSLQWRSEPGATPGWTQIAGVPMPTESNPVWLKLTRSGDLFSGYYSNDGQNWIFAGSTTTVFPSDPCLVGLAVTSHNDLLLNTSTFEDVSVSGGGGNPAPPSSGFTGFTFIANENETYTFSQTVDVAYGAEGSFNYEYGITGAVFFGNSRFGDPIPGVPKAGYYRVSP